MSEVFYALSNVDVRVKDDGTNAQFTLNVVNGPISRFFVNPEGLGRLVTTLKTASLEVAKRLNASGAAERYSRGLFENEPERVLSALVGVDQQSRQLSLAVQTEDGALVRLQLPSEIAVKLIEGLTSALADSGVSAPPQRH